MISNILLDFFYSFDEIYRAISSWELTQYFGVFTHQLAEFICRTLKKKFSFNVVNSTGSLVNFV